MEKKKRLKRSSHPRLSVWGCSVEWNLDKLKFQRWGFARDTSLPFTLKIHHSSKLLLSFKTWDLLWRGSKLTWSRAWLYWNKTCGLGEPGAAHTVWPRLTTVCKAFIETYITKGKVIWSNRKCKEYHFLRTIKRILISTFPFKQYECWFNSTLTPGATFWREQTLFNRDSFQIKTRYCAGPVFSVYPLATPGLTKSTTGLKREADSESLRPGPAAIIPT